MGSGLNTLWCLHVPTHCNQTSSAEYIKHQPFYLLLSVLVSAPCAEDGDIIKNRRSVGSDPLVVGDPQSFPAIFNLFGALAHTGVVHFVVDLISSYFLISNPLGIQRCGYYIGILLKTKDKFGLEVEKRILSLVSVRTEELRRRVKPGNSQVHHLHVKIPILIGVLGLGYLMLKVYREHFYYSLQAFKPVSIRILESMYNILSQGC